jgi:hypothetical protein
MDSVLIIVAAVGRSKDRRAGALPAAALMLCFAGMFAIEVAEHGLEHLQNGRGGHDAHADHRHLIKDDGVAGRSVAGHLLSRVGKVKRVGA